MWDRCPWTRGGGGHSTRLISPRWRTSGRWAERLLVGENPVALRELAQYIALSSCQAKIKLPPKSFGNRFEPRIRKMMSSGFHTEAHTVAAGFYFGATQVFSEKILNVAKVCGEKGGLWEWSGRSIKTTGEGISVGCKNVSGSPTTAG